MAGDWIKMRVDLADDPAVIGMAATLRISEDEAVGKMHRLWSWADKHTATGFVPHITEKWIDKHVNKAGFAKTLCSVGWLSIDSTGITFPHFDRHNGESAKSRALKTQSQTKWRAKKDKNVDQPSSTTASTSNSTTASTKFSTREEKRREESKPPYLAIDEIVKPLVVDKGEAGEKIPAEIDRETGEVVAWAA